MSTELFYLTLRDFARVDYVTPPLMIEISRAYVESHPSGHSFQLVIRVRGQAAQTTPWRVYRGNETRMTWLGNADEFAQYVKHAARIAISDLLNHEGNCQQR